MDFAEGSGTRLYASVQSAAIDQFDQSLPRTSLCNQHKIACGWLHRSSPRALAHHVERQLGYSHLTQKRRSDDDCAATLFAARIGQGNRVFSDPGGRVPLSIGDLRQRLMEAAARKSIRREGAHIFL